jgi:hypothetical protein
MQDADGATFRVIEGPEYFYFAVDKNHVYKRNQIFKDADPATFYYDKADRRNGPHRNGPSKYRNRYHNTYIIGDKRNKWEYVVPPNEIRKIGMR